MLFIVSIKNVVPEKSVEDLDAGHVDIGILAVPHPDFSPLAARHSVLPCPVIAFGLGTAAARPRTGTRPRVPASRVPPAAKR